MNKTILSIAAVLCIAALTGCGTIKGLGKDITSLGGLISDGSDHVSTSMKNNPPGSKMGTDSE